MDDHLDVTLLVVELDQLEAGGGTAGADHHRLPGHAGTSLERTLGEYGDAHNPRIFLREVVNQPDACGKQQAEEELRPALQLLLLGLGVILGSAGLGVVLLQGGLVHAELGLAVNLQEHGPGFRGNFRDSAVDAACGHHFVAFLEGVAELLHLLLLLALRTNHKEPHHHEDEDKHNPHSPAAALLGCSTGGRGRLENNSQEIHKALLFFIDQFIKHSVHEGTAFGRAVVFGDFNVFVDGGPVIDVGAGVSLGKAADDEGEVGGADASRIPLRGHFGDHLQGRHRARKDID